MRSSVEGSVVIEYGQRGKTKPRQGGEAPLPPAPLGTMTVSEISVSLSHPHCAGGCFKLSQAVIVSAFCMDHYTFALVKVNVICTEGDYSYIA